MRSSFRALLPALSALLPFVVAAACASSASTEDPGGSAARAGNGGSGNSGGSAGTGGQGGKAGKGGSAGAAQGGKAGEGQAGEGQAGDGGSAGDSQAGSGGEAGQGGSAGSEQAGQAGSGPADGENTADRCIDGKDNDGDTYIDCNDKDCCALVDCSKDATSYCGKLGQGGQGGGSGENTAALCGDGKDNDNDKFIDCNDKDCCPLVDCSGQPTTYCGKQENTVAACSDKKDNDGDTYADCNDKDCCSLVDCKGEPSSFCGKQQGGGGSGGAAGSGGSGGSGGGWPTCDEQPAGSTKTVLQAVWDKNPASYDPVWIEGLIISAVSFGECSDAGTFQCQMFLQTKSTYTSLADGKHQGIKLFVSEKASVHFTKLVPGDVVNLYGNAIRFKDQGYNELRIHVDLEHPGCAKKVGSTALTPIGGVALVDLTNDSYENTIGPLLVQVDTTKGRPTPDPTETFGIYETEQDGGFDAGLEETEVLTPYYLPGGKFLNLTPDKWTTFSSLVGVYSTFVRIDNGQPFKYRTLGPRTQDEIKALP